MYEVQSIHDLSSIIRSRQSPVDRSWQRVIGGALSLGLLVVCGYVQLSPRDNSIDSPPDVSLVPRGNGYSALPLIVSSPAPDQEIPASRVTIVGKAPSGVCSIRVQNEQAVLQQDRTFYLPNVGLQLGENSLEVIAYDCSGQVQNKKTTLVTSTSAVDPLSVQLSRATATIGDPITVTVSSPLVVKELRVDFDGDKLFDVIGKELTASHRYETAGLYPVWVVMETQDGLFFSSHLPSLAYSKPMVRVSNGYSAQKRVVEATVALPDVVDVEVSRKKEIWVLSRFLERLVRFDDRLFPQGMISLRQRGSVEEFALFANGDLVIVDRVRGEILRLDRTGKVVRGFGEKGIIRVAEGSALLSPTDIFVDQDDFLFVVDSGNKRLLKFTARGKFIAGVSFAVEPSRVAVEGLEVYVIDVSGKIHVLPDSLDGPERELVSGLRFRQLDKQFNNAYWTAVTEDDKICLYLSDGTPLTAPFQLEEAQAIRDVVLLPAVAEEKLVVGTAARLMLISLGANPNLPEARWEQFLTALRQGSPANIKGLMTTEAQAEFSRGKNSAAWEGYAKGYAKGYGEMLIPRERSNKRAVFETRPKGGDSAASVVFTRRGVDAPWLLDKFW